MIPRSSDSHSNHGQLQYQDQSLPQSQLCNLGSLDQYQPFLRYIFCYETLKEVDIVFNGLNIRVKDQVLIRFSGFWIRTYVDVSKSV